MPNLNEPSERFELDFGTIFIQSYLVEDRKRWINFPEKPFIGMQMLISNKNLRLDFKKDKEDDNPDGQYKPILKEDEIEVIIVMPNDSPYFEEKNERGAHIKLPTKFVDGKVFDMEMVDTSTKVEIEQSLLKLHLKQDVIIELFKCLEHNIMKRDDYSDHF